MKKIIQAMYYTKLYCWVCTDSIGIKNGQSAGPVFPDTVAAHLRAMAPMETQHSVNKLSFLCTKKDSLKW